MSEALWLKRRISKQGAKGSLLFQTMRPIQIW